jgi:hypothetical protein
MGWFFQKLRINLMGIYTFSSSTLFLLNDLMVAVPKKKIFKKYKKFRIFKNLPNINTKFSNFQNFNLITTKFKFSKII